MSFLDGLLKGAKVVAPMLVGSAANIVLPGSGNFVNGLIRKIAGDSPDTPIETSARKVAENPELHLQYMMKMAEQETRFRELGTEDLKTVNKTIQTESKSDNWWTSGWRPFNGFLYGITIFCTYFLLPLISKPIPEVPIYVWIGWGAILGITTYDRGKEKRVKAGDQNIGMISNLVTNLVKR